MANFGLEDLRVVNPYEVAFREAVSAVGGAHVLKSARVFETVAGAVADCSLVVGTTAAQKRELQQPIERIETSMQGIREHAGRVALLFGSEKFGLSNDDLSYCKRTDTAVEGVDVEQLTKMLLEVLEKSGYTKRITAVSTEQKIRRWVRRMRLTHRDIPLLLGILRQVLWKFEERPK
jgi:tRNA/rRNA methyltransferase